MLLVLISTSGTYNPIFISIQINKQNNDPPKHYLLQSGIYHTSGRFWKDATQINKFKYITYLLNFCILEDTHVYHIKKNMFVEILKN